jgi:hypothetical protein
MSPPLFQENTVASSSDCGRRPFPGHPAQERKKNGMRERNSGILYLNPRLHVKMRGMAGTPWNHGNLQIHERRKLADVAPGSI